MSELYRHLSEGSFCHVGACMKGYVYQSLGMGHEFIALKLDGQLRLVDTYQGFSAQSWLEEAWFYPLKYLEGFTDFHYGEPLAISPLILRGSL